MLPVLLVEASADKLLAHQQEVVEVWQLDKAGDTADNVEAVVEAYSHRVDSKAGKIDLEVGVPVDTHNAAVLVVVSQNHSCFQDLTP